MLKKEVKMIKNSRAMKVKLFALKMLMCCIAVGIIFIWMRGKGPATCLCDELCVSLHMAVALNLEGLLSVWQRGLLLCWYKTRWFLYKLGSFGVSFRAQEGLFFFGTCLFSFPKCPVSCWSGLAVRSQTSPRSAEVPQVLLHMFVVGQHDVDVAHIFLFWIGQGSADTRSCPPGSMLMEAWPETHCWSLAFLSLLVSLP